MLEKILLFSPGKLVKPPALLDGKRQELTNSYIVVIALSDTLNDASANFFNTLNGRHSMIKLYLPSSAQSIGKADGA